MGLAMRPLDRVRPHAMLVHRQGHQRDPEPGRDPLDERIGQSLDTAAAAGRHQGGERGGDGLAAIAGEDQLLRRRRPAPL